MRIWVCLFCFLPFFVVSVNALILCNSICFHQLHLLFFLMLRWSQPSLSEAWLLTQAYWRRLPQSLP